MFINRLSFFPGRLPTPGYDPIIGANFGNAREATGLDPSNASRTFTMQEGEFDWYKHLVDWLSRLSSDFVVSRGGEYFLTPSLSALNYISGIWVTREDLFYVGIHDGFNLWIHF